MARRKTNAERAEAALRAFGLRYPEAYEEFPWGERALKVNKKVFMFMSAGDDGLRVSLKLPQSAQEVLALPGVTPTGYGLGKSGWVTASFSPEEVPPVDILCDWIDESYRAIAPKKLILKIRHRS